MKRRDLLKTAGTMMLAAPAVRTSALLKSNSEAAQQGPPKNLVVSFSGAFCFWQDGNRYKVMVPPDGPDSKDRHLPWAGTTANTKSLEGFSNFILTVGGYTPPSGGMLPLFTGTGAFTYRQESGGGGATPMLNLFVPMPSQIIGIRPTGVNIKCKPGTTSPFCDKNLSLASGLSFVYQNVDLGQILITPDPSPNPADFYKACFSNDAFLQEATLTIHLTPLAYVQDPDHGHARHVWKQMLSMYPWMQDEIGGIDFCKDFDFSACPASCPQGPETPGKSPKPALPQVGPGSDCQVPIMVLPPGGGGKK